MGINPHEFSTTPGISNLQEPHQPNLDNGGTPARLQIGEKHSRVSHIAENKYTKRNLKENVIWRRGILTYLYLQIH